MSDTTYRIKITVDASDGYHEVSYMKLDEETALRLKEYQSQLKGLPFTDEENKRIDEEQEYDEDIKPWQKQCYGCGGVDDTENGERLSDGWYCGLCSRDLD